MCGVDGEGGCAFGETPDEFVHEVRDAEYGEEEEYDRLLTWSQWDDSRRRNWST